MFGLVWFGLVWLKSNAVYQSSIAGSVSRPLGARHPTTIDLQNCNPIANDGGLAPYDVYPTSSVPYARPRLCCWWAHTPYPRARRLLSGPRDHRNINEGGTPGSPSAASRLHASSPPAWAPRLRCSTHFPKSAPRCCTRRCPHVATARRQKAKLHICRQLNQSNVWCRVGLVGLVWFGLVGKIPFSFRQEFL